MFGKEASGYELHSTHKKDGPPLMRDDWELICPAQVLGCSLDYLYGRSGFGLDVEFNEVRISPNHVQSYPAFIPFIFMVLKDLCVTVARRMCQ